MGEDYAAIQTGRGLLVVRGADDSICWIWDHSRIAFKYVMVS
jgi:hypothetical protein